MLTLTARVPSGKLGASVPVVSRYRGSWNEPLPQRSAGQGDESTLGMCDRGATLLGGMPRRRMYVVVPAVLNPKDQLSYQQ